MQLIYTLKSRDWTIPHFQTFLVMKITGFLILLSILQGYAKPGNAQNITLSAKNLSVEQFLANLHQQTNFDFFYDAKVLKQTKPINLSVKDATISQVLQLALQNQQLTYTIKGNAVVIKKKESLMINKSSFDDLQQNTVNGKVTDTTGTPLPRASIKVKGTQRVTVTNDNGIFELKDIDPQSILIVSYTGFLTQEIPLNGKSTIEITLKEGFEGLDEVVVVGYGTQKKVNLTGAVDQVTSKVLENRAIPNLTQGLQGTIPNLNLVPLDGKPIQSPSYNVRGITSIGQGGNALVLIDGVEGDPSRLNPNDVATVSVLKDASSAAIYGARGAFGVILITTKNPNPDKTSVIYSFNHGIKSPVASPDFVTDGYQFATMFNDSWSAWNDYSQTPQNVNKTVKFSPQYLAEYQRRAADPSLPKVDVNEAGEYVYYGNTDWYKELYKDHNNSNDHNITISGSQGKSDFYVSGRMFNQSGLFRYNSDDYKSYNLRAKGSLQVFPWLRFANNADYSSIKYHNPLNVGEGGSIWRNISDEGHTMAPMFNPDGTLTYSAAYTVGDFWYGKNGTDMDRRVFRNTSSVNTNFFSNQLRINADFTFQQTNNDEQRRRIQVPYSRIPGVIEYVGTNTNDLQFTDRLTDYLATNVYTEYEPKLTGGHYVKALVGFNNEQSTFKSLTTTRNGLIFEDASDINLALGQSISTLGGREKWAIRGGFYRLNYAYKDRYLIETNGRYDGSSKFPEDQRFAFFPSISAGWRINSEPFWNVSPNFISELKLRASYGSLGNGSIASYAFQERYKITQSERILNGVRPQQTSQPGVLPEGLTWETSTTTNVGLDVSMLANRLTLVADAYMRRTTDMFTTGMTLPAVFGTNVPKGNYADLETKGWEVSIQWNDKFDLGAKPFHYNIRLNLADYQAEVTKYNNPDRRLSDYYTGQKLGEIWGFTTAGFYTSAEDITNSPKQILYKSSTSGQTLPGDIKFADLNGDGVIDKGTETVGNPGDMSIIGNTTPRYTYGINLGADWNRFSFSVFFQGVGKQDWYPGPEAAIFWGQYNRPYNKIPTWQLGEIWSEDNPNTYLPRYRGYIAQNTQGTLRQNQTGYLQNVAYIRMKNIQLGYMLPENWIKRLGMSATRVFVSGENLFTWSPLYKRAKDLDVENVWRSDAFLSPPDDDEAVKNPNDNNSGNGNNYPMLKSISFGISATF